MDQNTFDTFVRRTADLLDRRSLFGGLSAALLAANGVSLDAGAKGKHHHHHHHNNNGKSKSCKKRIKECREEVLPQCEGNPDPDCDDIVNACCKKACKSVNKADACLEENFPPG
jgi:hypothetical protein